MLLSELERTMRLDAEYFAAEYLTVAAQLKRHTRSSIAAVADISDGNHFSVSADYGETGIPYYRGQDVSGNFFVEESTPNCITPTAFQRGFMARSHLKKGDVLLSIVGTIGEASLVSDDKDATCSCKLAILRPRHVQPEYLAAFLRSQHGRGQIRRNTRGAVQMGFLLEDMDQIEVPRFSAHLESAICAAVHAAKTHRAAATTALVDATRTIEKSLRLESWHPPEQLGFAQPVADVFLTSRLDAEFHQPKYAAALDHVSAIFPTANLGELGVVLKGITVPYSSSGTIAIIRSGDLDNIDDDSVFLRANETETIFYLQRGAC